MKLLRQLCKQAFFLAMMLTAASRFGFRPTYHSEVMGQSKYT